MELRCINTFIQVAERKSFTKAAEALNYNQSTVSSQIKQLETELNMQLFERINHKVTLTEAGHLFLERAYQIINLVDELKADSANLSDTASPVRFAMAPSVCSVMMGETFLRFHRIHPEVTVKIIEADTESILQLLNQNDADLVFVVDRKNFSTDYVVASEKEEAVHFVISSSSEICNKSSLTIEDALKYPFLLSEKGISYRRMFDEKLAELNLSVSPVVEMGNTQLLLELVELGGGISLLPDYITKKSYIEGKIRYLDIKDFEISIWRQLIYHKNKWLSPSMKKIIAYCSEVSENIL